MSHKDKLIQEITRAMEMELAPIPGEIMSLADIERRLEAINGETHNMVVLSARKKDEEGGIGFDSYTNQLKALVDETVALKEKRAFIQEQQRNNVEATRRIEAATSALKEASPDITVWEEPMIRQLVETVKVLSANKIEIYLRGGVKVQQDMI